MIQQLSQQSVIAFMRSVSIMSLAVSKDNRPISSVVLFAIDDDFTIYFVTFKLSFKAEALLTNPQIGLSVWQSNQMLVQADGIASEITVSEDADAALEKIIESAGKLEGFWPPILQIKKDAPYVLFKVKLKWLRAHDMTLNTISVKENPYTEFHF